MKGLRSNMLEAKLLKAIQDGDDITAQILEKRILRKEKKNSIIQKGE